MVVPLGAAAEEDDDTAAARGGSWRANEEVCRAGPVEHSEASVAARLCRAAAVVVLEEVVSAESVPSWSVVAGRASSVVACARVVPLAEVVP